VGQGGAGRGEMASVTGGGLMAGLGMGRTGQDRCVSAVEGGGGGET
jgi:hypothetical protein